jgi:hypothetical protein
MKAKLGGNGRRLGDRHPRQEATAASGGLDIRSLNVAGNVVATNTIHVI